MIQELFRTVLYKRTQGRIARQVTAAVCAIIFALGAWRLSEFLAGDYSAPVQYGGAALVLAFGGWFSFRLVHLPLFADFLISVEAEMNKVSWPGKTELIRASAVVMLVMFLLAAVLFFFDIVWKTLLQMLGITG